MAELHVSIGDKRQMARGGRVISEAWNGAPFRSGLNPVRSLAPLVEGEIIPRLMLAHSPWALERRVPEPTPPARDAVERFAALSLQGEADALMPTIETLLDDGMTAEVIGWDLIAPAGRKLEADWADDRVSGVELTLGLGLLQQALRQLCLRGAPPAAANGLTVHVACVPGRRRTLEAALVEEAFRGAGWQVSADFDGAEDGVTQVVAREWIDAVVLLPDAAAAADKTPEILASMRRESRNQAVAAIVGARDQPDGLALTLGAHSGVAVCRDRQAVWTADGVLRDMTA